MFLFKGRDTHSRSFAKAMSWRLIGSIDTFLLSWFFTSSVKAAGAIASTEVISKMILYYFHERAWASWQWGTTAGDSAKQAEGAVSQEAALVLGDKQ